MNSVGNRYADEVQVSTTRRPYSRIHESSPAGIFFGRAGVLHSVWVLSADDCIAAALCRLNLGRKYHEDEDAAVAARIVAGDEGIGTGVGSETHRQDSPLSRRTGTRSEERFFKTFFGTG
jgi:hypothetical protein